MRNLRFVILCSVIFLVFFVGAPLFLLLTRSGVLPYENVGNQISVEKTYREDHPLYEPLTAIEKGKAAIKDTYINYLPGFLSITNAFKPMKAAIDRPMLDWLAARGRTMIPVVCHHVYQTEVISPTCTEGGYTNITCRLCGEHGTRDATPAKGHRFAAAETAVAAGCEQYGYTPVPCLDCRYVMLENVTEPTGHRYGLVERVSPTCTAEGTLTYQCADCPSTHTVFIPISHHYEYHAGEDLFACRYCDAEFASPDGETGEHQHSIDSVTILPQCDGAGYDYSMCTVCGDSWVEDIVQPTGHRYRSHVTGATCTEQGYTVKSCQTCGDRKTIQGTEALGHRYEKVTVKPTVYEEGYDLNTCLRCSHAYKTNFVPRLFLGIDLPGSEEDPPGTQYSASLRSKNAMFRIYDLTATYPDGTQDFSTVRVIAHDRDGLYQNMLETVDFMNAMAEVKPEVNWYFSFATNIEAIALGNKFFPEESVAYIYEEFLNSLPHNAQAAEIAVNSFKDYANKFYITDHHWNYLGVQEAYYRILAMLRENYEDIAPMPLNSLYVFDGVKFYGSLARQNASYTYYDQFGLYYYDLPPHSLTIDRTVVYGSQNTLSQNLAIYLAGNYETRRGYNHYTEFYRVPSEIVYPENNTGRRLLVIGDSYSLPLIELVAASFDVTYVRYEDRDWNAMPADLYFDEFVEQNGITDVLVIEEPVKSIMKGYGTHYPSGFLNIYPTRAYKED